MIHKSYYINVFDEQNRYVELKIDHTQVGQADSHTFSYLYVRQMYQSMGQVMGLDKIVKQSD